MLTIEAMHVIIITINNKIALILIILTHVNILIILIISYVISKITIGVFCSLQA